MSVRLRRFIKCSGVLPTTEFAYQKGLGICEALLCVIHTMQSALESGQEASIVQIDFSAVFDIVNHQGIFYNFCSVGIGGSSFVVNTNKVSIKPIRARYGGRLSE